MSGLVEDEPGDRLQSESRIHVCIRSAAESRDFTVGGDCSVHQLKLGLSERLGSSAEQVVLIHSGRVLRNSDLMSHLKGQNGPVRLHMIQRTQPSSAHHPINPASETVTSKSGAVPDTDPGSTATPTSPFCLVQGLDSLDLENNGPGFFPSIQCQMESQLLGDPEMMRLVLGSSFVQSTLSTSSPQLTRQLILSNPQIQKLLQTNPEVEDMLNDADVMKQVLELIRNPDMIEQILQNEDDELNIVSSDPDNCKTLPSDSDVHQATEAKMQQDSLKQPQINVPPVVMTTSGNPETPEGRSSPTSPLSSHSTDPIGELTAPPRAGPNPHGSITAGMQSLLEEITASPTLMESLLSGPYVSSLLKCLSQNPDLAAQMLLSHPLFSGNPQLQQQMRQQIPLFLQQMQSPELLSAMFNPRTLEALLQVQQGLQTLAAEAPCIIPVLGTDSASVHAAPELTSDSAFNRPQVATVTEQQQQFVQQMLQALANTSEGVRHEEEDFQEELDQLSSVGFKDRQANLQALICTGGDLLTAIQRLLNL
ncbi:ubiquilin-1-like [Xenentodon cancila]